MNIPDNFKTTPEKTLFIIHLPDITKDEMEQLEFCSKFIHQQHFVSKLSILRDKMCIMGSDWSFINDIQPLDDSKLVGKELILICGVKLDDLVFSLQQKTDSFIVAISNYSYMHNVLHTVVSVDIQNKYFLKIK